jgi:TonB-dependent SusC/RagA subfamily outer membrane receptor
MKKFMLLAFLFMSVHAYAQSEVKVLRSAEESKKSQPLLVVDGAVLNTPTQEEFDKQMKAIEPNSIDKIDVLKGESATKSAYGDKALNGVILITTKKKKE